jgi:hypothetical protein
LRRQGSAGDTFGRGAIVIADPDADYQIVRKTDEPGIAMILAGAGLAGHRLTLKRGGSPGPTLNHSLEQAC